MSTADTKVAASPTRMTGARRPKRGHTAARGVMGAALAMGVQYRADCGRWLWPIANPRVIKSASDLHPTKTCQQCAEVILGKRRRLGA